MTARFKVDRWGVEGLDGNSLWTSSNGSRDGLGSKQVCHQGGLRNETIIHALRDCPKAQAILSFGGLDGCLLNYPYESCLIGLKTLLTYLILRHLRISSQSYGMFGMVATMHCFRVRGMMLVLDSIVGIGIIVRDHNGFVLGCRMVFLDYKMNVEWAKVEV
ncbi:hypothetical protein Golob_006213 [Gossypium lobatum]|uniref:Reverse transcriptase zinc-binding domain-containing protein n=1 Tax=Gossypium lobatum TaxID=34289 RepID=A0A7J8MVL0_9ROSI|nr:hypothetical protein [Gossypium lobatum]